MATVDARFINDSGVTELEGTIDLPNGSGDTLETVLTAGSDGAQVGITNAGNIATGGGDLDTATGSVITGGGTILTNGGDIDTDGGGLELNGGAIASAGNVEIDGNLNHDGTGVGFYGTNPAAQPQVPAIAVVQDVVDALVTLGLITQAA